MAKEGSPTKLASLTMSYEHSGKNAIEGLVNMSDKLKEVAEKHEIPKLHMTIDTKKFGFGVMIMIFLSSNAIIKNNIIKNEAQEYWYFLVEEG